MQGKVPLWSHFLGYTYNDPASTKGAGGELRKFKHSEWNFNISKGSYQENNRHHFAVQTNFS